MAPAVAWNLWWYFDARSKWRIDIRALTDGEYSQLATATWRWPRTTFKSLFLESTDAQHFDLMHCTNFTVAWQGIEVPASPSAFY